MKDGAKPEARTLRLGIAAFRFDPETVGRMLRFIEVPWESTRIESVADESLSPVDTVFLLNPTLEESQWNAVLRHADAGGTSIVLLTPSLTAHTESSGMLARLGLRTGYTRAVKKLKLVYSGSYPVSHKRAHGDYMLCSEPTRFITFHSRGPAEQHVPLMRAKLLLSRPCLVMQVNWGRGAIVFSNSASLPEDRADVVTYLLQMAAERRLRAKTGLPQPVPEDLSGLIMELFEVYDEVPLDVVARELSKTTPELDRLGLLSAIEQCIRGGELAARIRGDTIVRRW